MYLDIKIDIAIRYNYVDLGLAVATPVGLVTFVLEEQTPCAVWDSPVYRIQRQQSSEQVATGNCQVIQDPISSDEIDYRTRTFV